ncbi:MAG: hypothetical protein PUA93_07155 [Eubacteriales bacterium]|nr:hypothetical protein [Eubacteriales bacterium]
MGLFLLFLFLGIFALILTFTIGPRYVSPSISPSLKEGLLSEDGTSYIGEKEVVPYIESYSIVYHAESRTRYARVVYTGKAHSLAYDLFLFDKNHRAFKVLTLDFPIIDEKTKTHYIALPPSTRGLLIRIREADGASYPKDDQFVPDPKKRLIGSIITALFAGLGSFSLNIAFTHLIHFSWTGESAPSVNLFLFLCIALIVAVLVFLFSYFFAPMIDEALSSPKRAKKVETPTEEKKTSEETEPAFGKKEEGGKKE